jgi:peroxiredoxin
MKRQSLWAASCVACLIAFGMLFGIPARSDASYSPLKEHTLAPAFKVKTLKGNTVRLADLKGRVVLLDFGAVECPPCRLQMPVLEGWHKKYRKQGLVVVGLIEMNPTPADVRKMLRERGVTYPVAIDPQESIGKRYGLEAHPTTVLIDRTGRVVKTETGYVRGDEKAMERALLPLLTSGKR